MKRAGKAARIDQLIEAGAWIDAALALVDFELPAWRLRRFNFLLPPPTWAESPKKTRWFGEPRYRNFINEKARMKGALCACNGVIALMRSLAAPAGCSDKCRSEVRNFRQVRLKFGSTPLLLISEN
jgi:hypothetical protein